MKLNKFPKIAFSFFIVYFFISVAGIATLAQKNWQNITSVENVCEAYPEQIKSIFQNLNLNYQGLEEVKKAYEADNIPLACKNLLAYYGKSDRIDKDLPPVSEKTTSTADSVIHDIYTFQLVSDKVPRLADGHLKWDYMGPENDIEWAWALNRHYPMNELMKAYSETGNPKYVTYIDRFIKDWIIKSWPYPAVKSGTAMWRGLEVSFRAKVWAHVFYELWNTKLISPATQLLILSSLPDHAHYARNFHAQGNWLTMEISGLATVASSWPEFKESKSWMDYSIETMVASMKEQVYPDGVQTELTSSYHHVALSNFNLFANICRKNDVPLPEYYTKTLESMYNYLAMTIRPNGFGLLNNDADLNNNRESVLKAATEYNRPDWAYIASNGKSGTKPTDGPSYLFPYAGQLISRSGFDADAQWSFFDIGPWGSGHQHSDKLHLSVSAFGHDFLVDAGRFAYRGEVAKKFRSYATGSLGHNLILMDGKGQLPGPKQVEEPLPENQYRITPMYDFGSASFEQFDGLKDVKHTRSLIYVRGEFWVVIDKLSCKESHKIEALWHWHPDCLVEKQNGGIVSGKIKNGGLEIIPVGKTDWNIELIKGQEKPEIQGWYSSEYNVFEPNVASVYSTQIESDETFVWLIFPASDLSVKPSATIISKTNLALTLKVTVPGKGDCIISCNESNEKEPVSIFKTFQ